MVSFDQFVGLLRAYLLDTKGVEVVLGPYMPIDRLFMDPVDWQRFGIASLKHLRFRVATDVPPNPASTILDVYFESLEKAQRDPAWMGHLPYPFSTSARHLH